MTDVLKDLMPASPEMDKADAAVDESAEALYKSRPGRTFQERTIPIAEIFGPTIQGEGVLAGRPTYFVRVGGCDYACVWCDTDHAVLAAKVRELPRFTQAEIWEKLRNHAAAHPGPDWVAISGGNPGMYDLGLVVDEWQRSKSASGWGRKVTVETQGSRWQPWFAKVNALTVSPKPPSSGLSSAASFRALELFISRMADAQEEGLRSAYDPSGKTLNVANQDMYLEDHQQVLKCIVFDEADYEFARSVHGRWPLIPFYLSTGTAMGGLSGKWVPPPVPDQDEEIYPDLFKQQRQHPDLNWTPRNYTDTMPNLLRRYRWLVERMMNDERMSDVAVFPQLHALIWGIDTRGV